MRDVIKQSTERHIRATGGGTTRSTVTVEVSSADIRLEDFELRALLNAYMNADPHPWSDEDDIVIYDLIERESIARGYETWVDSFHYFTKKQNADGIWIDTYSNK